MKLYVWDTCPFCRKVLNFIESNNVENIEIVTIGKDEQSRQLIIDKINKFQVPLLEDNEKYIPESDDIIEYIKNKQ